MPTISVVWKRFSEGVWLTVKDELNNLLANVYMPGNPSVDEVNQFLCDNGHMGSEIVPNHIGDVPG